MRIPLSVDAATSDRRRARNDRRTLIRARWLWDGTGAPLVRDAALAIEGDRIIYVGTYEEAARRGIARRTDYDEFVRLPEATLLPAFMDLHLHLSDDGWTPLRLLSYGIATVRDTGNSHRALIRLRERQRRGEWVGPRIRTFGPLIDAAPPHWPHLAQPIWEGDDVEAVVDRLIADGVDGLKTYVRATPDLVGRVAARAREHRVPVTCHCGVCKASEALRRGVGSVEHVWSLDVLEPGQTWADLDTDSSRVLDLMDLFLETKAWFAPTLAVMKAGELGWTEAFTRFPGYDEYPGYLRSWLAKVIDTTGWDEKRFSLVAEGFRRMAALTRVFFQAGVPMLVGSDAPFVPVGMGLHYELELLVEAGLPNDAVLAMATRQGARYLGLDEKLGTLERGKLADIVAVHGDPLADIRATRKVDALWIEGRSVDVEALRAKADRIVARAPSTHSSRIPPFGIPGGAS